ncbi:LysE family translocator [Zeaxanthinibacter enoshimensis]|uniref:Threonine/homoserine/homoserine lactone efflux protein n=1 Tax=Zeaxanthinibacter enoshimensis TaxID=392009 RepID=A0A4R6TJ05_9FLAO|nr:LysE family translocator [Zeaxanthinibacter enoshimensis]TDQ29216.1 threonine/homoserine/homoserine lactone efflux protein [Zeaxanthinibacter enoshimensis]
MNFEILTAFVFATAALAIAPGPDNIYVLTQSIAHGRKSGLATTAGLISGCLVHTTLLAFGVSMVIRQNEQLYFVIKLFGALYLFYLAWMVFRAGSDIRLDSGAVPRKSLSRLFRQGFVMNVLNPKVTIFFLAFFPGFLFSNSMGLVYQFYILGFIFMAVSFVIFGTLALLAGSIAGYLKSHRGTGLFLKWLQILVFTGIGMWLLISGN